MTHPAVFVFADSGEVFRDGVEASIGQIGFGDQWFTPVGFLPDRTLLFLSMPKRWEPPYGAVTVTVPQA